MNIADIPGRDQVFLNPWLGDYLHANYIKHSEVARAMQLDPSIIMLWANGRRPVPHNRLEALAAALELSLDEVLSHALTVEGGYFQRTFRRAQPPVADVTPVVRVEIALAEVVAPPRPKLPPSEVKLSWCRHGPGGRLHHHGPVSVLGPLGSIAEWTRERDPKPYVRPQSVIPHVVWPTRSPPVPTPVSEPPAIELTETAPGVIFDMFESLPVAEPPPPTERCSECGYMREVTREGIHRHTRLAAHRAALQLAQAQASVVLAPTEDVQQVHIRRAQVRRVREVVEAPFVTAHHRGHVALGLACDCETS